MFAEYLPSVLPLTVVLLALALLACADHATAGESVYYVSPAGDDAWSGRLAKPNADKTDGPWKTLPLNRGHDQAHAAQARTVVDRTGGGNEQSTLLARLLEVPEELDDDLLFLVPAEGNAGRGIQCAGRRSEMVEQRQEAIAFVERLTIA